MGERLARSPKTSRRFLVGITTNRFECGKEASSSSALRLVPLSPVIDRPQEGLYDCHVKVSSDKAEMVCGCYKDNHHSPAKCATKSREGGPKARERPLGKRESQRAKSLRIRGRRKA